MYFDIWRAEITKKFIFPLNKFDFKSTFKFESTLQQAAEE